MSIIFCIFNSCTLHNVSYSTNNFNCKRMEIPTKECKKCGATHPLTFFNKNKTSRDGHINACKDCCKAYYKANSEHIKQIRMNNYYENLERVSEYCKNYYVDNKETISIQQKDYYKDNREARAEYQVAYIKNRRKKDKLFKLRGDLGARTSTAFKTGYYTKATSTQKLLGAEYSYAVEYLENNPYGHKVGDGGIDIDHIVPLSSATTKEELISLCHYTNLQLLDSNYNRNVKRKNKFNQKNYNKYINNTIGWGTTI